MTPSCGKVVLTTGGTSGTERLFDRVDMSSSSRRRNSIARHRRRRAKPQRELTTSSPIPLPRSAFVLSAVPLI